MNNIVKADYPQLGIAQITMEDRESNNTFSAGIIQGLEAAFANLKSDTKVVILNGYDNYFCCGGTQNELLKLTQGNVTFADSLFFRLLLDCPIPTIAAIQGHALGGGLVLGCYADIIIMAEESLYSANFMRYGFTPGMGATYILPKKLGAQLGLEMLFTAKNYHGGELKNRNAQVIVVKKAEVINHAFSLAQELVEKPLVSLKLLKNHTTQTIKAELANVIKQEIMMHSITFKLPEVLERIQNKFGQ